MRENSQWGKSEVRGGTAGVCSLISERDAFSCQVPGSSELQYHHVYTVHTMPLHFLSTQVQESCQSIHEKTKELKLLGEKK